MHEEVIEIKPQPGFQTKVAMSDADITVIGGAAGCGKSFIMLYIPLKYKDDKNLRATYFRRTKAMIREQGALWDESTKLYPLFNAEPSESILKWRFPSGGMVDFAGIEYEKDLINFQGAQIPLMLFDELTHFTKKQFIFMIGRNRGAKKGSLVKKSQIFASCNPDPDSWVALLVEWYIDPETGYPIPEREGVKRYFIAIEDKFVWGNTKKEVYESCKDFPYFSNEDFKKSGMHPGTLIKSFTFIGGKIYDNKKLLENDPGYLGNLLAGDEADQERFLKGNWKIRSDDKGLFQLNAIERMFLDSSLEETKRILSYSSSTGEQIVGIDVDYSNNFITCDAARFGRDLCVIMVWKGWTVVHTTIFYLSSPHDIYTEIEDLRIKFRVVRQNTLIDQDGVGGDVVKIGRYYGFMARRLPARDETNKEPENYKSRKDQCYYHASNRINNGTIKYIALPGTVKIFDRGAKNPRWSTKLKWNKDMIDIKVLIRKQLGAIKKGESVAEGGGVIKICTNTKEEQIEILGHSPDFADNFMMRQDFSLLRTRTGSFGGL